MIKCNDCLGGSDCSGGRETLLFKLTSPTLVDLHCGEVLNVDSLFFLLVD